MSALVSLALLIGAVDCSPVAPAAATDSSAARAYFEVAVEELESGAEETGAAALRESLRLNPASAPARARWAQLCAASSSTVVLAAARAVESEQYAAAVQLLRPTAATDPSSALLYGIALYELGEDSQAATSFERARMAPLTADTAALFLGLLALRAGESDRASELFKQAGRSSSLAQTASELRRLASREGRLAVSAELEGGYDSNVDQAPDRSPAEGFSGDVLFGGTVSGLYRPFGMRGPYAQGNARYRNLLEVDAYDVGSIAAGAGWAFGAGAASASVEYGFDALWLGGAPLLFAHSVRAAAGASKWGALWSAAALVRSESYVSSAFSAFSGWSGGWEGAARVAVPGGGFAWLRYRGELHDSQQDRLSWLDHVVGARGQVSLWLIRVVAEADLTFRRYGAAEPGFGGLIRDDRYLDGALSLERDLTRELALRFGLSVRRSFSNVTGLEYTRFAATAGIVYAAGLL